MSYIPGWDCCKFFFASPIDKCSKGFIFVHCLIWLFNLGGDSKGPANGRRHCTTGKYWRVYEYTRRGNQSLTSHYIRVQFALVSRESGVVEIHTISANATAKTVKITNTTAENFDQVMKRNDHYKSIGKIRDGKWLFYLDQVHSDCPHFLQNTAGVKGKGQRSVS